MTKEIKKAKFRKNISMFGAVLYFAAFLLGIGFGEYLWFSSLPLAFCFLYGFYYHRKQYIALLEEQTLNDFIDSKEGKN